MALPKLLQIVAGLKAELNPVVVSAGVSSASSIVATNASGVIDTTMMPVISATSITSPPYALTYATTLTVNWANGMCQKLTLTGNTTLTFSNPVAGAHYLLEVTQDATGSRTITWPTVRWQGGTAPTLTPTANKTDLVILIYDGTSYFGQAALNF